MLLPKLVRVSRTRRCPICERGDWCLVSPDDPPSRVICARVADGSLRKVSGRHGDVGYLHVLRDDCRPWMKPPVSISLMTAGTIDFSKTADEFRGAVDDLELSRLADSLGLAIAGLRRLGIGWSCRHRAWSFPMVDAGGTTRGIRLRYVDGRKLAVRGGREGLFVPADLEKADKLLICEGPTDSAALIDLGFAAVGRPSCSGGLGLLVDLVRRRQQREVVIVADADLPGRRGADNLASVLVAYVPTVRIIEPPDGVKDARAWKRNGANSAEVVAAINNATPHSLGLTTKLVDRKAGCRNGR